MSKYEFVAHEMIFGAFCLAAMIAGFILGSFGIPREFVAILIFGVCLYVPFGLMCYAMADYYFTYLHKWGK